MQYKLRCDIPQKNSDVMIHRHPAGGALKEHGCDAPLQTKDTPTPKDATCVRLLNSCIASFKADRGEHAWVVLGVALAHVAASPSTAAAAAAADALDGQRLADVCAQELAPVLTHVLDDGLWHQACEVCCWLAGVRPGKVQRRQLVDLCRGGDTAHIAFVGAAGRHMLEAGDHAALLAGAKTHTVVLPPNATNV